MMKPPPSLLQAEQAQFPHSTVLRTVAQLGSRPRPPLGASALPPFRTAASGPARRQGAPPRRARPRSSPPLALRAPRAHAPRSAELRSRDGAAERAGPAGPGGAGRRRGEAPAPGQAPRGQGTGGCGWVGAVSRLSARGVPGEPGARWMRGVPAVPPSRVGARGSLGALTGRGAPGPRWQPLCMGRCSEPGGRGADMGAGGFWGCWRLTWACWRCPAGRLAPRGAPSGVPCSVGGTAPDVRCWEGCGMLCGTGRVQGAPHSASLSCAALWRGKVSWAAQPGWGGSCGDWWGLCPAASLWGEAGLWAPGHAVKCWRG